MFNNFINTSFCSERDPNNWSLDNWSSTVTTWSYANSTFINVIFLQVERAFDNLVNYHDSPERDIRFQVNCGSGNKGIHIRSGVLDAPKEYAVTVEPIFADADNVG